MPTCSILKFGLPLAVLLCLTASFGQQAPLSYGDPVTIENARKAADAAREQAEKNHLQMAIAIVDPGGELVYFEKMNGTQTASVAIAIAKARTAALFRRPTKVFEDAVAAGGDGLRFLGMPGVTPVNGGYPLIVAGKVVGAIGASGGTSAQDGECSLAGSSAFK